MKTVNHKITICIGPIDYLLDKPYGSGWWRLSVFLEPNEETTYENVKTALKAALKRLDHLVFYFNSYDNAIDFNIIRALVKEGIVLPSEVTIEYKSGSTLHVLSIDKDGRVDQWPNDMFFEFDRSLVALL